MLRTIKKIGEWIAQQRILWSYVPDKNAWLTLRLTRREIKIRQMAVDKNITPEALGHWLPALIDPEKQRVVWLQRGKERFPKPYFDQTIWLMLMAKAVVTDLAMLEKVTAISPGLQPKGFIFHTSRCGSTLLSSMLSSVPSNLVIAESGALSASLRPTPQIDSATQALLFRNLVLGLGQAHLPAEKNLFIKFTSWNFLQLDLIRQAFPDVPCVFLYRNPVEVMVSHVNNPPSWLQTKSSATSASATTEKANNQPTDAAGAADYWSLPKDTDLLQLYTTFPDVNLQQVAEMEIAEYSARAIGSFFERAVQNINHNTLLIN